LRHTWLLLLWLLVFKLKLISMLLNCLKLCSCHCQRLLGSICLLLELFKLHLILSVVEILRCLLFLNGFGVLDLLCKQRQVLRHRTEVLHLLRFGLGILIYIVLGEFLL
jgi:hypothetical protein